MQHSSFRFRHSTFHKQQSSFLIRSSSSVECTFIFSHPTFSICPLSFRFRHPTLDIVLARRLQVSDSTFNFSNSTLTRWSATDGDRGLNWPNPPLLKWWSRVGRETSQWSGLGRPSPLPLQTTGNPGSLIVPQYG